jgi:hypothetical protein
MVFGFLSLWLLNWMRGEFCILEDSLTTFERQVCENAICAMSDQLNANLSRDPWQAKIHLTEQQLAELKKVRELLSSAGLL